MKFWYLTAIVFWMLLSFLPGIGLGYPRLTDAKSQVVAQSRDNSFVCYMQTPDGTTVNLTNLCGLQPTSTVNPARVSAADAEAIKMPISRVRYDGNFLSGRVTNQTDDTVQGVKVNYEVRDRKGNLIDNGFIDAQPSTIPPGGSASFSGMTVKGAKVQPTFVDWSN
ncbi:MAG TPA: hypothetical protein DCE56_14250 [Cyanobacteria bacterium UBA8553]|nr:hypothetical protein [Cyanobacteria bacterium UBA8553]HAJ59128.1 hypothetical protein [Cyanobacteria bacterium UBA8543]